MRKGYDNALIRDVIYSLGFRFLDMLSPFLVLALVSNFFSPEALGLYSTAAAAHAIIYLISEWGSGSIGVVSIANEQHSANRLNYIKQYVTLRLSMSLVFITLFLMLLIDCESTYKEAFFLTLYLLSSVPLSFALAWVSHGEKDFSTPLLFSATTKLAYLFCLAVTFLLNSPTDILFIGVWFFVANCMLGALYCYWIRELPWSLLTRDVSKSFILPGLNLTLSNSLLTSQSHGVILFASRIFGLETAGVINVSYKIPALFASLLHPIIHATLPRIAKRAKGGHAEVLRESKPIIVLILVVGFLLALMSVVLAPLVLSILSLEAFDTAYIAIFSACIPLMALNVMLGNAYTMSGRLDVWRRIQLASFGVIFVMSTISWWIHDPFALAIGVFFALVAAFVIACFDYVKADAHRDEA